jgi:ADP-dependent phosphofructokinase/glucokinase
MKDHWRLKYQKAGDLEGRDQVSVLTGFNANIDVLHDLENLKISFDDVEPELVNPLQSRDDLLSSLKFCVVNGVNEEVRRKNFRENIEGGQERIGGQGAIMANFLSSMGNYTVFYTPLLSEELAEKMDEEVVYPEVEGKLVLKRVSQCVNTDRTKKNTIIEFNEEETGRMIISGEVKGFGPYFRKGVEESFDTLEEELDRMILSGFQNVKGNLESKLEKAKMQLEKIDTPKHLEYVRMDKEKRRKVLEDLLGAFESIGMDEEEVKEVAEHLDIDTSEHLSLGHAYQVGRKLVDEKVSRCHIHTYRYHLVVADGDYPIGEAAIQRAMLLGSVSALSLAEKGEIPGEKDVEKFDIDDKHIHRLDELEHFGDHMDLEDFAETGMAEIEGKKVVAIPNMIHEDPERLVGMGDIISSGAFVEEVR